jgi:thioesterase domain-containing protein
VFGFPPPLLNEDQTSYQIERLAASFVELIRAKQPHGPYFLMGNCFGGFIVYETARQLEASGEQIAFLGLMNTYRSSSGTAVRRKDEHALDWGELRHRIDVHSRTVSELRATEKIRFAMGRWRGLARRLRRTANRQTYRLLARTGMRIPESLLLQDYASEYALSLYHPQPCRSAALLIRVIDHRSDDRQMGWQGLFGGEVELLRVPHELWTEQGVAFYGPDVSRRLNEARKRVLESGSAGEFSDRTLSTK